MPRTLASNDKFDVLPPGLFRGLKVMLGLGEMEEMNWRVVHKPSGTVFILSEAQHAEIEKLTDELPSQGPNVRKAAKDLLLQQVQKYWHERDNAN